MNTAARNILVDALRLGVRITPKTATTVWVEYDGELDPAFEARIKRHKPALLRLLRTKRHLAKQVLEGEFDGASLATWHAVRESLVENLLDVQCRAALDHLRTNRRHPHPR